MNWAKAVEVGLSLLISPIIGFVFAASLLRLMKRLFRNPNLYHPPGEGDNPPHWIRGVLLATCGGVSFAHGTNDGQKGMGLILLTLIGFLPTYYALNVRTTGLAGELRTAAQTIDSIIENESGQTADELRRSELHVIRTALEGKTSLAEVSPADRWSVRQAILHVQNGLNQSSLTPQTRQALEACHKEFARAIEYVPFWVDSGRRLGPGSWHDHRLQANRGDGR